MFLFYFQSLEVTVGPISQPHFIHSSQQRSPFTPILDGPALANTTANTRAPRPLSQCIPLPPVPSISLPLLQKMDPHQRQIPQNTPQIANLPNSRSHKKTGSPRSSQVLIRLPTPFPLIRHTVPITPVFILLPAYSRHQHYQDRGQKPGQVQVIKIC